MTSDGANARPEVDGALPRPIAIFGSSRYGQYYEDLLAGVVGAADGLDGSVIAFQISAGVMPSGFEVAGQSAVSRAAWDHFDAAIVVLQAVTLEYVAALRAAGKYVIAIGQVLRGTEAAIAIDNAGGVRQAVTHLAGHGHTEIGCIAATWQADAVERYEAYVACMVDLGLTALPLMGADLPPDLSMDEQGYIAAQRFLAGDHRSCTAMLVGTDLIALGFIRGLQEAGLQIPDDVAVVGIDDVDEAAVSVPPLATVAISFERVGEAAYDVALRGGRGEPMAARYEVPQRFVPRESCGCHSGAVAAATGESTTALAAFVETMVDAGQEGAGELFVDRSVVVAVARQVIAHLVPPLEQNAADRPPLDVLAGRLIELCALDRSVQTALNAIRTLSDALADDLRGRDPDRAWAISSNTLDLCDAIRTGQLQRRMAEYVDLKRMQLNHYWIGNSLLGGHRHELRSLSWLQQTPAQAGVLGLWDPPGDRAHDRIQVLGTYERTTTQQHVTGPDHERQLGRPESTLVEAFPPAWILRDSSGKGRLVIIQQVTFQESDWGLIAIGGERILQSSLVQETFQQCAILMSASLDQEKADADLARQAEELSAAYQTEMALLEEVRLSEERYALAAEASHDALWDWDIASGKVFYSSSWKALLGYHDNEVGAGSQEWLGRVHPDDALMVREQVNRTLSGTEQFLDFEHRLRSAGGEYRWMACSGRSVADQDGRPSRLVGSITDVTVRKLLQDQLLQEAMYDGLTGLAKNTLFKEKLNEAFEKARRIPDYWFAVLFLDLDGFKAVNDNLGHAAGDELLACVAGRLKESLRKHDVAARLGGDEFAIILSDVDEVSELPVIVRRIQQLIRMPHQVGDQIANVSAAIGVAVSSSRFSSADEMLHEADSAMYRAKRKNKQATAGLHHDPAIRLTLD